MEKRYAGFKKCSSNALDMKYFTQVEQTIILLANAIKYELHCTS